MSRIFGLNFAHSNHDDFVTAPPAKVAIFSLASDFGCQLQITNVEEHLLDVLGMFDLVYWQLASSADVPDEYDIAIVEGAVTSMEHIALLKQIRQTAEVVMAIGACACTGGIPGLIGDGVVEGITAVYGTTPTSARDARTPTPLHDHVVVDYEVYGCPIDSLEFVRALQKALLGVGGRSCAETLCGSCRINERECFYSRGEICMGLVTATGCDARCIANNRACNGCRGLARDANIASAREIVARYGLDVDVFDQKLEVFNRARVSSSQQ